MHIDETAPLDSMRFIREKVFGLHSDGQLGHIVHCRTTIPILGARTDDR